jgi:hypothetical protein
VAADEMQVWGADGLNQLVTIGLLSIEFVGAVEGRFVDVSFVVVSTFLHISVHRLTSGT